jgi:hypothetical protein
VLTLVPVLLLAPQFPWGHNLKAAALQSSLVRRYSLQQSSSSFSFYSLSQTIKFFV